MLHSDLSLARLIEASTRDGDRAFIEARGGDWMALAGTGVFYDRVDSPLTQTFGLGLFAPVTAGQLDQIEAFYAHRGAATNHEVSPFAGIETMALLASRGYRPIEFSSVLYLDLSLWTPPPPSPVTAAPANFSEARLLAELGARGWATSEAGAQLPFYDFMLSLANAAFAASGAQPYLARLDGQPIATAILRCHDTVASLDGACTIPSARRQGAQTALLHARLQAAITQDCRIATMSAQPGSSSQHNAERHGFRIAYTRTKWRLG
jgi:hypothetical protein